MDASDYPRFAQKWNSVNEAKQGKPFTERGLMQVFQVLQCYEFDDVCKALNKFLSNPDEGMYHLQPASIVKILQGNSESSAMIAWTVVEKLIRQCGAGQDIVMADKLAMKVINDLGGLIRTQDLLEKDLPFYANEFKTLYQRYRISGCDSYPEMLKGKDNTQRLMHNLPILPPRYIGFSNEPNKEMPELTEQRQEIENISGEKVDPEEVKENLRKLLGMVQA
jgi:hypothetical protein